MTIQFIFRSLIIATWIFCGPLFAKTGLPIVVAATGGVSNYTLNLWLNGPGHLSGRQYSIITGNTVTITPTNDRCYNSIGIDMMTSGYTISSGCSYFIGNMCIVSACPGTPAVLTISSPEGSCGGTGGACRIFRTSSATTGAIAAGGLTGLDAANYMCNHDGNTPGTGTYAAWLSTATRNAIDNVGYQSAKEYIAIQNNNAVVFDATTPIGNVAAPLAAIIVGGPTVWTGTNALGEAVLGSLCDDWVNGSGNVNGIVGLPSAVASSTWTNAATFACNAGVPLYCFEVPA